LLQGKVMVVTGAGNGVGAEIAKLAASCGAKVVVNDAGVTTSGEGRDPTVADRMVEGIRAAGGTAVASVRNVADWDDAHGIVQDALDAFGRIDAVVNNAGILRDVIFHKMTADDWNAVINVHLGGAFYVSRAAAEHFRKQHRLTWQEMLLLPQAEPQFEAPSPYYEASHYETPHYRTRWHKVLVTTFRLIAMLLVVFSL